MNLLGKKIAVLVEQQYEDLELWYPVLRFREAGAEVMIVGPQKKSYLSKHGYEARADICVDDLHAVDLDAVVIPGGYSPDHMRRHESMVNLVRDVANAGNVVAAICHAGWMLCSAGVLKGKKATCFFAIKDDLINAGAEYVDEEVVRDRNIITSRFPDDLPAFCRTIGDALNDS
jgi:protease I